MAANPSLKARIEAAAAWFNLGRSQDEPPKRARTASGTQFRCSQCVDGTRTCVVCFGVVAKRAKDNTEPVCVPCGGKGRVRCPTCRGEAYVGGY